MLKAVIFDMYETLITLHAAKKYFKEEICADADIPVSIFKVPWHAAEEDRSIGKITLEEIIERILCENNRYSEDLYNKIIHKRVESKVEAFRHLHPEIIPMLSSLIQKDLRIGLISNCYSEEAELIKQSELYCYFDVPILSWDIGLMKPNPAIFQNCMERLGVKPEECLYVGDGGSMELETVQSLGMTAVQATWYIRDHLEHSVGLKPEFMQADHPLQIAEFAEDLMR